VSVSASPYADGELSRVVQALLRLDPTGERFARVFRTTFDQLYDGQRTGRYKWDQLFKTEKTHYGTLIEINLQREFLFEDGIVLDYKIAGVEVDCKYSFRDGGWMLPPESWNKLILVATASDESSLWSVGVVRVENDNRRTSVNRDGKTGLSLAGREAITWVFRRAEFPPNVLLQLEDQAVDAIFSRRTGQAKLDELFRRAEGRRIHRNTIATVAQQQDYMKRVRSNGGSRTNLKPEGYVLLGGDYLIHRQLSIDLGGPTPAPGEVVSLRVVPTTPNDPKAVEIDGGFWRRAESGVVVTVPAPNLPSTITGAG
jgi:hypothetical protein